MEVMGRGFKQNYAGISNVFSSWFYLQIPLPGVMLSQMRPLAETLVTVVV